MSPVAHSIEQPHLYNSLPFHQTLSLMDTLVCFCWLLSPYKDLHVATNLLNFSFYFVSISFQTHKQILIGGKKKSSFLALLQTSTFKKNLCRQQSQLPYPDFLVYARSGGGPPLPCFVLKLCFFPFFRQPSYLYSFRDKKV